MTSAKLIHFIDDKKVFLRHALWVFGLSLLAAGLAAFFLDQRVALFFNQPYLMEFRRYAREITNVGLSQHYFIISVFLYIYMRFFAPRLKPWINHPQKTDYLRRWALNFFAALVFSGLFIQVVKMVVGRQRPHRSSPVFDPFVFDPFTAHWHWHSFPSGHSQTMFAVATMMTLAFPRLTWLWFLFAVLMCSTRVIIHDHFVSDTIMGACFGYLATLLTLYWMRKKTKNGL